MSIQPDESSCSYGDLEGMSYDDVAQATKPVVRSALEEICLMCGGIGRWSSLHANAIFTAAAGHRLEYIEGPTLIVLDSCQKHVVI